MCKKNLLAVGAQVSPTRDGACSHFISMGGVSQAVTIKKEEKPFAFFRGVNDLPNQCLIVWFKTVRHALA